MGKNEPVCIADEVPFDIPDSWEWVRFCNLVQYSMGKTPPRKEPEYWSNPVFPWVSIADMVSDGIIINTKESVSEYASKNTFKGHLSTIGTLIMSFKLTVGKVSILGINAYHNEAIISILPFIDNDKITTYYLFFTLPLLSQQGETKKAIKGNTLNSTSLDRLLIPLPPVREQERICKKLKELVPKLSNYDVIYNTSVNLESKFPEQLKNSILQQAVQGKLVPQDPTDEPAEVLLARIREEKQRLIKEGKIKKDKHESIIYRRDNSHYEKCGSEEVCIDNELDFDIPKSWGLIRLNDIGIYRKGPFGSALTKSMFVKKGIDTVKVYEQKNAIKKDHTLGNYYITRKYYNEKMKNFSVKPGDIIVSCAGTIGETYIMPKDIEEGIINQALMRMEIFAPINIDYFLLYFDYVLKESAKANSKGSAIKNIPPFEIFKKLILPLPPLEEQKRIVKQVGLLETLCTALG
ncbi:MAG: restriction endonuclease subunit S [Clostridiales bacterium]|nr:restriction endonuclease subunit S [Clostridiales bacterium]